MSIIGGARRQSWPVIAILALLISACAEPLPEVTNGGGKLQFKSDEYTTLTTEDARIGGRLYDRWWVESTAQNIQPPTEDNPVWTAERVKIAANIRSGSSTWRCKECHGWDYLGADGDYDTRSSHYTGFTGVFATGSQRTQEEIFNFIAHGTTEKGNAHAFEDYLTPKDIYRLTKFIVDEVPRAIGSLSSGNITRGQRLFVPSTSSTSVSACGNNACHGQEERKQLVITLAKENPIEFIHKARFGEPNTAMKGEQSISQAKDILAYLLDLGKNDPDPGATTPFVFDQTRYDSAAKRQSDLIRGGRLYDKWWKVKGLASGPSTNHPSWPASNTAIQGADTWRCKECHGWDYRGKDGAYGEGDHATGIRGIITTASFTIRRETPKQVFDQIQDGRNHSFLVQDFTEDDLYGLTRFVLSIRDQATRDNLPFNYIGDVSKKASGSSESGLALYQGTSFGCLGCHGADGRKIAMGGNEDEYVDTIALENPWEFAHKVLFGQPDDSMPDTAEWNDFANTIKNAVNVLTYAQTDLLSERVDVLRGGRLYDKWWAEKSATAPVENHPLWPTANTQVQGANTWRCKECHGWDYLGVDGAYGDTASKHFTGIKGLLNTTMTEAELQAFIHSGTVTNSGDHAFGDYLDDRDINDLAGFLVEPTIGMRRVDNVYNAGDVADGKLVYETKSVGNCSGCHGIKGDSYSGILPLVAVDNPAEFLHKSRFGQPGSIMVPTTLGAFTGVNFQQAVDVLAYSRTLSGPGTGGEGFLLRGGRLYDKWWVEADLTPPTEYNAIWQALGGNIDPAVTPAEDSWRCKNCHGWNYQGSNKISSSPNLFDLIQGRTEQYLFDIIKEGYLQTSISATENVHVYGTYLSDADIQDLVRFLKDGVINTRDYITTFGMVDCSPGKGCDFATGRGIYQGTIGTSDYCERCHGPDGKSLAGHPELDIFQLSLDNPWEFLHKSRFGQPGTDMPGIEGMTFGDSSQALTTDHARDVLYFSQDARAPQQQ